MLNAEEPSRQFSEPLKRNPSDSEVVRNLGQPLRRRGFAIPGGMTPSYFTILISFSRLVVK